MPEFIVQKLNPALRPGQQLTLTHSNLPAFAYQGAYDSGCAIHAAAIAMAMLGQLSDPVRLSSRRGREAEYWNRVRRFYVSGLPLADLAKLILELRWGLHPIVFEAGHTQVTEFCEREVLRGRPVILALRAMSRSYLHAVLIVGVEGRQTGRAFEAHTLLLLDSAEYDPGLTAFNARLTYAGREVGKRPAQALYVTASTKRQVVVTGAISLHAKVSPK